MTLSRMNFDLREPCCSLLMLGLIMTHRMPLSGPPQWPSVGAGLRPRSPGPGRLGHPDARRRGLGRAVTRSL
jgi:hypothetical protein